MSNKTPPTEGKAMTAKLMPGEATSRIFEALARIARLPSEERRKDEREYILRYDVMTEVIKIREALLVAQDQGDGSREGRFECSANGHTIYDTDFTNDGSLAVTGDFASDEDRIAYARRITDKLNARPSARKDAPEQAVRELAAFARGVIANEPVQDQRADHADTATTEESLCVTSATTNHSQQSFKTQNSSQTRGGSDSLNRSANGLISSAHPPRLDAQTVEECAKVCDAAAKKAADTRKALPDDDNKARDAMDCYAEQHAFEYAAAAIRALRST